MTVRHTHRKLRWCMKLHPAEVWACLAVFEPFLRRRISHMRKKMVGCV